MSANPVVIAKVSDLHAGGTTAMCPATIRLDDGGEYQASKVQKWLWQCWWDYWDTVERYRKRYKADLYVILNGDLVEGDHHKTTQILSGNPNAQAAVVDQAHHREHPVEEAKKRRRRRTLLAPRQN